MNGLIQVQTEALRNFNICIKHQKKKKKRKLVSGPKDCRQNVLLN